MTRTVRPVDDIQEKPMEYVTVGSTGVQVSPLCFGAMSFGSEADEPTSAEMFRRVRDAGINFFDVADVYGGGASEEILGRLIGDSRDDVVLTSKVFYPTGSDVNATGLSRRHIVRGVEASLSRLGTERLHHGRPLHRVRREDGHRTRNPRRGLDHVTPDGDRSHHRCPQPFPARSLPRGP